MPVTNQAPKTKTPVRNSPVPKNAPSKGTSFSTSKREITSEMIAERAYFISISGNGGSQDDNWHRAELELRNGK